MPLDSGDIIIFILFLVFCDWEAPPSGIFQVSNIKPNVCHFESCIKTIKLCTFDRIFWLFETCITWIWEKNGSRNPSVIGRPLYNMKLQWIWKKRKNFYMIEHLVALISSEAPWYVGYYTRLPPGRSGFNSPARQGFILLFFSKNRKLKTPFWALPTEKFENYFFTVMSLHQLLV